ncbi:MAG: hypothetical protein C4345_14435 [Chloroflexota bacterium]
MRLELLAPARVRWTADGWQHWRDDVTQDRGLGVHVLDLPVRELPVGTRIEFTMFWTDANRWATISTWRSKPVTPPKAS